VCTRFQRLVQDKVIVRRLSFRRDLVLDYEGLTRLLRSRSCYLNIRSAHFPHHQGRKEGIICIRVNSKKTDMKTNVKRRSRGERGKLEIRKV
jgi:hypothetical protein